MYLSCQSHLLFEKERINYFKSQIFLACDMEKFTNKYACDFINFDQKPVGMAELVERGPRVQAIVSSIPGPVKPMTYL